MRIFSKWPILLMAVVGSLLLIPYLIPLNGYISNVESIAGKLLKQPVSIQSIRAGSLPIPHIVLKDIVVGTANPTKIGSLKITFINPFAVFYEKRVRAFVLTDIEVPQEALNYIAALLKPGEEQVNRMLIDQIRLRNVNLIMKTSLVPFNANIDLSADGKLEDASIYTMDNKLRAFIKPLEENFSLNIEGDQWANPFGIPVLFDRLSMRGIIADTNLSFTGISGQLYGGTIHGKVNLSWQNTWHLTGQVQIQKLEVSSLVELMNSKTTMSGKLDAHAQFFMAARTAEKLTENIVLNGQFNIRDGELLNFDLAKAVKTFTKEGVHGGSTRFDEFTGNVKMLNKTVEVNQLKISSGVLVADGDISIAPNKNLSGAVSVELKGSAKLVSIPLTVKGTMNNPVLKLSNSALAGAVAGTAVLGPGVGTSVGAKVGEFFGKLFGKKKEDSSQSTQRDPVQSSN